MRRASCSAHGEGRVEPKDLTGAVGIDSLVAMRYVGPVMNRPKAIHTTPMDHLAVSPQSPLPRAQY